MVNYTLQDKTVLITGATDGLGKLVALHAAQAGATLLLHGRNAAKGAEVLDELKYFSGNDDIRYYNADFASLADVKTMTDELLADNKQLHVLINNAAIGGGPMGKGERALSRDGYELRFAVNHLAHFLLTQQLLPLLERSAPSRVVNVSSIGQLPLDFEDIHLTKKFDSYDAYTKSKLAQIVFGFELAERVKNKGITVNSLHPATLMNTNMVNEFFGKSSSTVEEGAAVVEHIAFAEETAGITGAYFNQLRQTKANAQAYDEGARKRLWEMSEELVKAFA